MNARCHIVDPSRIRLLLTDDLSEAEKAELELHLETCEACSGVIERALGGHRVVGGGTPVCCLPIWAPRPR